MQPITLRYIPAKISTNALISDSPPPSSELDVYPFGATVTAWRRRGVNVLFLSPQADLSGSKAIRGGIPICFPQFGSGPLPAHGFARTSLWQVVSSTLTGEAPSIVFRLTECEATAALWPHRFIFDYTVQLTDTVTTTFRIENSDDTPFSFQLALHTYFSVADVNAVRLTGLAGLRYIDKLRAQEIFTETDPELRITREIDRVYLGIGDTGAGDTGTGDTLAIKDTVSLTKSGLPDAVVWNPWEGKSKQFTDLGPGDYNRFVCLEAGRIEHPVLLKPGATWSAQQIIRAL